MVPKLKNRERNRENALPNPFVFSQLSPPLPLWKALTSLKEMHISLWILAHKL